MELQSQHSDPRFSVLELILFAFVRWELVLWDVVSPGQPELRRGERLPVIRNLEPRGKPMHYGLGSCDE